MAEGKTYQIHLDNFDGPLDLLLHLIDKNQMDIYDIPIAVITAQYLDFLEDAREMDLEIASEFLLTAATLLNIKARMLLPRRPSNDGEPEEDPRAELVRRLVEYRFYKETAQLLRSREQKEPSYMLKPQDVERMTRELEPGNPLENVTPEQLWRAFAQAMEQAAAEEAPHELTLVREEYLVEDCIEEVRDRLKRDGGTEFSALFGRGSSRRKIITVFMALLELCRLGELTFRQQSNFGALWVFPKTARGEVE